MIAYECFGCSEHCRLSSGIPLTGCVYEDGDFGREAKLWLPIDASEATKNALKKHITATKIHHESNPSN